MSDPEQEETILIDQLLVSAASFFPPIMSLEEKEDFREEIIDYLVFRISELFQQCAGGSLRVTEKAKLLERLCKQAPTAWGQ